jgi:thioredoxin 1
VNSVRDWNYRLGRAGPSLVVAQFHAPWCPYCRHVQPIFRNIAEEHDNVVFLSVNADQQRAVVSQNGVRAVPTFKFFKNGRNVDTVSTIDGSRLRNMISRLE